MSDPVALRAPERWAQLRFSIVGPLLASPPETGKLHDELIRLAATLWRHPQTGQAVCFAVSTIERWYYQARAAEDPVGALRRRPRRDSGANRAVAAELAAALRAQHGAHPSWSVKLHLDNLAVVAAEHPTWGPPPSYASLRRYMIARGLLRRRRIPAGERQRRAHDHRPAREVRSYEAEYVGGLWHLDFHHGSRKILDASGQWVRPILLAILDDRSRLICHAQWYLAETAQSLVHGLTQAFLKRGLPRALLHDNGSAMLAGETVQGLQRLSILQQTTLPYSPHQNGKQEVFWAQVEGRLLAMLEGQEQIDLALLNQATLAWVEGEYHRTAHSETGQTPLKRWLDGPCVGRPCPDVETLRLAFTAALSRTQRRSDGTISLAGTRFEVPSHLRSVRQIQIRYAAWDLRHVWLMDERAGRALQRLFPLDRARNAEGLRRPLPTAPEPATVCPPTGIAPLLRKLLADYAATGLPPAYIPTEES